MKTRLAQFATLLVVATVGITAVAAGGHGKFSTKLRLRGLDGAGASGVLYAAKRVCERGRFVKLYRLDGERDRIVAVTRTAPSGRWEIEQDLAPGRYYASAQAKPAKRTGRFCGRDETVPKRLKAP